MLAAFVMKQMSCKMLPLSRREKEMFGFGVGQGGWTAKE